MSFAVLKRRLGDFSELVMFQHSVFSLPFIFVAMVVGARGWFGWRLLVLGALAAVTARNFAMGVNRWLDRDIDALNPRTRTRPSVDGRVNQRQMILFVLLNAAAFIATAWAINDLAFALSLPILVVLGAYTLFKRFSALAHLVLGLSLGLAPIAGAVAVTASIPSWSLWLAAGVTFWVAGFDLLYSLQDMEFDRAHGLHSIPAKLGARRTLLLAALFHLAALLFWAVFVLDARLGPFAWSAVLCSALMLGYEHRLVHKDFSRIDRAFFTVNGYLGFLFFALILADILTGNR